MKKLVFFALAAATAAVYPNDIRAEEEADDAQLAITGGFVRRFGSGKGKILVLNAQERVKNDSLQEALDLFNRFMHLPLEVRSGKLDGQPGKAKVKDLKASLVIFVTDRADGEDSLLVAPESRWAMVNVAALDDDDPTPDRLVDRAQKEVVRAFGLLCGSANSTHESTVMGPVKAYLDLDRIKLVNYPLDAYDRTQRYLKGMGVTPFVQTTYRAACEQGWADAPTNKYQKAIWDEVHAAPQKPLKIEFDPKRDAGK